LIWIYIIKKWKRINIILFFNATNIKKKKKKKKKKKIKIKLFFKEKKKKKKKKKTGIHNLKVFKVINKKCSYIEDNIKQ